jgi:hypothetical protein
MFLFCMSNRTTVSCCSAHHRADKRGGADEQVAHEAEAAGQALVATAACRMPVGLSLLGKAGKLRSIAHGKQVGRGD